MLTLQALHEPTQMCLWSYGWEISGISCTPRGINVYLSKVQAIITMQPPATLTQLKSFLSKLSYIRRFIPGLAALTAAFAPLLKKGKPFHWDSRYQQAFLQLQQLMTKLPTICAPIPGKPLKLYLATNNEAIGALIAQEDQEGIERPVYYVSRKLKDAKTHYSRAERACLALIYAA